MKIDCCLEDAQGGTCNWYNTFSLQIRIVLKIALLPPQPFFAVLTV
jgi:hypothetical protein